MNNQAPKTQKVARGEIERALAQGGEHLGDLVWPEVRLGSAQIERTEIVNRLIDEGLPEGWAPPEPSGQKAFGRALSHCRNLNTAPNVSIEREELRSRVALVRHSVGQGLDKETATWARISVDDFDDLKIEWSRQPDIQAAIAGPLGSTVYAHVQTAITTLTAEHRRHMNYTDSQEVGSMVTDVLQRRLRAVRIRREGGLYFVPTAEGKQLRAFSRVVSKIAESRLPFLPAFDTPEGRSSLGSSVSDTLHAEVRKVLGGLKKLGKDAKGPRESSLHRRLEELDGLSARAETCRILLADYSVGIHSAVKSAKEHVLSMMELDDE